MDANTMVEVGIYDSAVCDHEWQAMGDSGLVRCCKCCLGVSKSTVPDAVVATYAPGTDP